MFGPDVARSLIIFLSHHLWQGICLCLLAMFLTRQSAGRNAATRYWIWFSALTGMLVLPFLAMAPRPAFFPQPASKPFYQSPGLATGVGDSSETAREVIQPLPVPTTTPGFIGPVPDQRISGASDVVGSPRHELFRLILLVWLAGILFGFVRLAIGAFHFSRIRRGAEPLPPKSPLALWFADRDSVSTPNRTVTLRLSKTIGGPMAVGFARPLIILPHYFLARFELDSLKPVILHELAHIRRRDSWLFLAQKLAETVFFYHPGVRWAAKKLDLERESACDAWAVSQEGNPGRFARILVEVYESMSQYRTPAPAVGAVHNKTQLTNRVERLLKPDKKMAVVSPKSILLAGLLFTGACLSFGLTTPAPWRGAVTFPNQSSDKAKSESAQSEGRGSASFGSGSMAFAQAAGDGKGFEYGSVNSNHHHVDDDLSVIIRGKIVFSDDETRVLSISPKGLFQLRDEAGVPREVDIRADRKGNLSFRYWVDGKEASFESEGAAWLAEFLPGYLAEAAINAEARIDRIIQERGIAGALNFIDTIKSNYARSRYYEIMIDTDQLGESDYVSIAKAAARMTSDYQKSKLCQKLIERTESALALAAIAEGLDGFSSDYHQTEVMTAIAKNRFVNEEIFQTMVRSSARIKSDFHKAQFLKESLERLSTERLLASGFLDAAENIESDHHFQEVMSGLLERGDLGEPEIARILGLAGKTVESDHHLALLLRKVADRISNPDAYLEAVASIQSDHHRGRALISLLESGGLDETALAAIAASASKIKSDHQIHMVLSGILEQSQSETVVLAVREAMKEMNSNHYSRRLEQQIGK